METHAGAKFRSEPYTLAEVKGAIAWAVEERPLPSDLFGPHMSGAVAEVASYCGPDEIIPVLQGISIGLRLAEARRDGR